MFEPSEPVRLECPKCGNIWYSKAKGRTKCSKCKKMIPKTMLATKVANNATKAAIRDNIAKGNIIEAMNQAGIDPLSPNKFLGDAIVHILEDHNILLALGNASKKRKKPSKYIIRKAVEKWLKEEGFL